MNDLSRLLDFDPFGFKTWAFAVQQKEHVRSRNSDTMFRLGKHNFNALEGVLTATSSTKVVSTGSSFVAGNRASVHLEECRLTVHLKAMGDSGGTCDGRPISRDAIVALIEDSNLFSKLECFGISSRSFETGDVWPSFRMKYVRRRKDFGLKFVLRRKMKAGRDCELREKQHLQWITEQFICLRRS